MHDFAQRAGARIPAMADLNNYLPAIDIVGAAASVFGLGYTIYVLCVAKDAKRAAEAARDAALSAVRKRSLVEDLGDAVRMVEQVGLLIQRDEWMAIHMRTEEIVGTCKSAMARWGDALDDETRTGVMTATTMLQTIAGKSSEFGVRELTPAEKGKMVLTHLRASGLIHTALGEARRLEERNENNNAD